MRKWAYSVFLSILVLSCAGTKNTAPVNGHPVKNNSAMRYIYSDGNANRYIVSKDSFEYIPVKPVESSTGQYSGGEPVKTTTDPAQFSKLEGFVQSAYDTKDQHAAERGKGTGSVERIESNGSTVFILAMNSTWRSEIEALLTKMKTGS